MIFIIIIIIIIIDIWEHNAGLVMIFEQIQFVDREKGLLVVDDAGLVIKLLLRFEYQESKFSFSISTAFCIRAHDNVCWNSFLWFLVSSYSTSCRLCILLRSCVHFCWCCDSFALGHFSLDEVLIVSWLYLFVGSLFVDSASVVVVHVCVVIYSFSLLSLRYL